MALSPYPIDPYLTGLAIAYKNTDYIADMIAPRRSVGKQLFEWDQYTVADLFTVPDMKVGRRSQPNQVTFSATRLQNSTEDYALDSPVPLADIENADENQDPLAFAVQGVMELVKLGREERVANATFSLSSYLSTQRTTLSGTSQWSDYTNSSPRSVIMAALDACLVRPNTLVFGSAGWTVFRQHPEIVKAIRPTDSGSGVVSRQQVAELLELDQVLVGVGWKNGAKPGQTFAQTRLWGKSVAALYIDPNAQLMGNVTTPTFMLSAEWGTPIAGSTFDKNIGMRGGQMVRAGESLKEVVIGNQGAYFWNAAFA